MNSNFPQQPHCPDDERTMNHFGGEYEGLPVEGRRTPVNEIIISFFGSDSRYRLGVWATVA